MSHGYGHHDKGKGRGHDNGHHDRSHGHDTATKFQIELGGHFKDYDDNEDKILKRAFMAGFPQAKFSIRGQEYEYDFKRMEQHNKHSGKTRKIRKPFKMEQPSKPIVPPGKTTVVRVQPGWPGTTQLVPYPQVKGQPHNPAMIAVSVPPGAKVGQTMLVPVPDVSAGGSGTHLPEPAAGQSGGSDSAGKPKPGWSTGGKVAAGAAVVGIGGVAVGGAILGMAAGGVLGADAAGVAGGVIDGAGDAAGAAGDAIGDGAAAAADWAAPVIADAGDAIGDGAAVVGDWAGDAAGDVGDWAASVDVGDIAGDVGEFAGDAGDFMIDGAEDVGDFVMDLF